jgi:hypothetical protein
MNDAPTITIEAGQQSGASSVTYYPELIQGSDEWLQARCGLLTASEMHLILTPTLKTANNDKERAHLYELLAQRITKYVEPHYISDDMLRGQEDEVDARLLYGEHFAPVQDMGFITNNRWGFTIGYSPDGLVGRDGLIECKSRRQKFQVQTTLECLPDDVAPMDYMMQLQTGLLVSERQWIDFISYTGGMHMITIRVHPDEKIQDAILSAAAAFEERIAAKLERYKEIIATHDRLIPTQRRMEQEITL